MSLTKAERAALESVYGYLDIFTNPDDPACAVSPEAREEARLYLATWVMPKVAAVLAPVGTTVRRDGLDFVSRSRIQRGREALARDLS